MRKRLCGFSWALCAALLAVSFSGLPAGVFAEDLTDQQILVEKARVTFMNFMADENMSWLHDNLKNARGVLIIPELMKAGFVLGGSGGSGVLLVRDPKTGQWNGPAFYTIGEASFGLQIGGEAAEVVLVAMTERGVTALLSHSVKLGGDVGVAAGPGGVGVDASTANLRADIIGYSLSKGRYGGVSIEGAVVGVRNDWNQPTTRM